MCVCVLSHPTTHVCIPIALNLLKFPPETARASLVRPGKNLLLLLRDGFFFFIFILVWRDICARRHRHRRFVHVRLNGVPRGTRRRLALERNLIPETLRARRAACARVRCVCGYLCALAPQRSRHVLVCVCVCECGHRNGI